MAKKTKIRVFKSKIRRRQKQWLKKQIEEFRKAFDFIKNIEYKAYKAKEEKETKQEQYVFDF